MALETGTYISDLVTTNPVGSTDPKSQGDDHIRLIKSTIKTTFPNITGAVTPTHSELNILDGVSASAAQLNQLNGQGALISDAFADGAGSVNAITADFTPNVSLTDGLTVLVKAVGQITSTTPTFAPDGLTAKTIVKGNGEALSLGDIAGANQSLLLQYDSTLDNWILLNPNTPSHRGCLVYDASDQSITTATLEYVAFDTEEYDTDTIHDNATNNTRLTVPTGVTKVKLRAQVVWTANATGFRQAQMRKNGSGTAWTGQPRNTTNNLGGTVQTMHQVSTPVIEVTGGDYFELEVYQDSGGGLNVAGGQNNTWFSMEIIE